MKQIRMFRRSSENVVVESYLNDVKKTRWCKEFESRNSERPSLIDFNEVKCDFGKMIDVHTANITTRFEWISRC